MASRARIRLQTGGSRVSAFLGEWREGKVRPIPGNAPHDRPVSRGMSSLWSICDDPFRTTRFPPLLGNIPVVRYAFSKAWRNLSGPMGFKNQNLSRDRAASRWSAPRPGQRTRREDHVLSHRPQMSSGRLFLDRVARQHCPSPLHQQPEHNTHASRGQAKGDISTLPTRGHFYFALTEILPSLTLGSSVTYSVGSTLALRPGRSAYAGKQAPGSGNRGTVSGLDIGQRR